MLIGWALVALLAGAVAWLWLVGRYTFVDMKGLVVKYDRITGRAEILAPEMPASGATSTTAPRVGSGVVPPVPEILRAIEGREPEPVTAPEVLREFGAERLRRVTDPHILRALSGEAAPSVPAATDTASATATAPRRTSHGNRETAQR